MSGKNGFSKDRAGRMSRHGGQSAAASGGTGPCPSSAAPPAGWRDPEYLFGRIWRKTMRLPIKAGLRRAQRRIDRGEDPWNALVKRCQERISAVLGPESARYQRSEAYTWEPVAKWLYLSRERLGDRVLDIGCGYGTLAVYARELLGGRTHCVDVSGSLLPAGARDALGIRLRVADIEREPVPWEGDFDVVLFTEVLEHLHLHPLPLLERLRALLSTDGRLYLTTPDPVEWGRRVCRYPSLAAMPVANPDVGNIADHVYHYSRRELHWLFGQAGLAILRQSHAPGVSARHLAFELARSGPDPVRGSEAHVSGPEAR